MRKHSRIVALGRYQPVRVVTNEELAKLVDTDDQWIRSRVGIATRHLADTETVADMAVAAGAKAMANAGLSGSDIDYLLVATTTSLRRASVSFQAAQRLGIPTAFSQDLNTACSGFSYALALADHAIQAGSARRVLVIGSERYSDVIDWSDRSTSVIFADGAGAAVVCEDTSSGVGPVVWGSVPSLGHAVVITTEAPMTMQGQSVFRWATTELPAIAIAACHRAGVDPQEIAAFVPHQANLRIIDAIAGKIGLRPDVVIARDIIGSGNTGAASIPIALSKLVERGEIASGAPVLLWGFGGGLAYAGQVVQCP